MKSPWRDSTLIPWAHEMVWLTSDWSRRPARRPFSAEPMSELRRPRLIRGSLCRWHFTAKAQTSTMDEADIRSLHAFRAAALQVRNASVIASGATVGMHAETTPEGAQMRFQLLSEEPFRSLAISLRLVYMQGEPAHYNYVCNLLYRDGAGEIQRRVADCRARYKSILEGHYVRFNLHGEFEGQVAGPQDVFEAWLYGLVFHQDHKKREIADELGKYMGGFAFPFALNLIALQLAGAILDLDDVIADHLVEERVPRIEPARGNEPAA